jgi:hypothetical protein
MLIPHTLNVCTTKSSSEAVTDVEERVSAMKLLIQGTLPLPRGWLKLMAPSKKLTGGAHAKAPAAPGMALPQVT